MLDDIIIEVDFRTLVQNILRENCSSVGEKAIMILKMRNIIESIDQDIRNHPWDYEDDRSDS